MDMDSLISEWDTLAVWELDNVAPSEVIDFLVGCSLKQVERQLLLRTLSHHNGNRTRAAKLLGVSVRTLRNKIHEYEAHGVAVPEPRFLSKAGLPNLIEN